MSNPPASLSSNWKALQKSLKRKSPVDEESLKSSKTSSPPVAAKRPKTSGTTESTTKKSMATSQSTNGTPSNGTKLVLRTTAVAKSQKLSSTSDIPKSQASTTSTSTLGSRKSAIAWAKEHDLDPTAVTEAYSSTSTTTTLTSSNPAKSSEAGRYIAIDCEMVGVGPPDNEQSALARVSLVNYNGHCVLDTFVKPKERVTDWRTWVSGVSSKDMAKAITLEEAQRKVHEIIDGKILIGHAIHHDLDAMFLSHPKRDIRDTSRHPPFRKIAKQKNPGLKRLAKEVLGVEIQGSAHSSVEDARVTMLLYRKEKKEFEKLAAERFGTIQKGKQKQMPRGNKKKKKKKRQTDEKTSCTNGTDAMLSKDQNQSESDSEESDEDFDDWLA
ncbi:3'-5' exonuclease [Orbilia ellipsospora]|uniref:RNA exonuclease 4 n=1 Tax=Orbilia ellipsospora TaxID=2528407 RepID=A0AAV9XUC6_9PEZI